MPKTPTKWVQNPALYEDNYNYVDANIPYNSDIYTYSGVISPIPSMSGKQATAWQQNSKAATEWDHNPQYDDNLRPYDGDYLYDSADLTYDGVVTGEQSISTKQPTQWRSA